MGEFRKDRTTTSARWGSQLGYFEKTVNRTEQLLDLFQNWFNRSERTIERNPLAAVAQAPRIGNCHFLSLVASRGIGRENGETVE